MKHSVKIGFSFGTTSGVMTTLGMVVGLTASNASKEIILAGILTIAFADAFSDSMGIHISEETERVHTKKEIWISTLSTYFSKLIISLTFLLPILYYRSTTALIASIIWGLTLLSILSYLISPREKKVETVIEHIFVGLIVVVFGFVIGQYIQTLI